jgi:hypothetical protein
MQFYISREVLTLNRDYFRLRGGLERRLYEFADKYAGHGLANIKLRSKPSQYVKRAGLRHLLDDPVFVNLLDWYVADNMTWSSDYPNGRQLFPIQRIMSPSIEQDFCDRPAKSRARYRCRAVRAQLTEARSKSGAAEPAF